jgi:hypothetical protein
VLAYLVAKFEDLPLHRRPEAKLDDLMNMTMHIDLEHSDGGV